MTVGYIERWRWGLAIKAREIFPRATKLAYRGREHPS